MKRKILLILAFLLGLCGLGAVLLFGIIAYLSMDLPQISSLADYRPPMAAQIVARNGTVLAELGLENRQVVAFEDIPQRVIDAFISAEDAGFYEHSGIDLEGILRAAANNILAGKVVQGGSTITQQVAKTLLLTREKSFVRKIKDLLLAYRIEKMFTKQEILFLYLNQVYLGAGHYGVKAAAKGYFNKALSEISIAEAAMLAGLLVAPGRYSPHINPKAAYGRQRYVLKRMLENNKITAEEEAAAIQESIKYYYKENKKVLAPYFVEWVRQRVVEIVGEEKFLTEGLKVTTTLDLDLQQIAEKALMMGVKEVDKRQGYLGPLGTVNIGPELIEFEKEMRKNILEEKSHYFTYTRDEEGGYQRLYEHHFDEEEFTAVKAAQQEWVGHLKNMAWPAGMVAKDSFNKNIEVEKNYTAVVTRVDDHAKLVFITIAGVSGIIPLEGLAWAHERKIDENVFYSYTITRPSQVLKEGDKILVEVKKVGVSAWPYVDKTWATRHEKMEAAEEIKRQRYVLADLDQKPTIQAALLSLHPRTGEIYAFVGGTDFKESKFNRVIQALRQPGSSFKPFIYACALENGYTPATIIMDTPEALASNDDLLNWKPRNYDGKFLGPVTLRSALEHSRNVPTIKITDDLSIPVVLKFAERLGISAKLDDNLSLALGSFGISLMDIVTGYGVFANRGKILDAKSVLSITDRNGNTYELDENLKKNKILEKEKERLAALGPTPQEENAENPSVPELDIIKSNPFQSSLTTEQVYDPRLAYLMTNLLRGVVLYGTGRGAKEVSSFLAGKTGTTNNYVDAWFVGYSATVLTGVWVGNDDNTSMGHGETGSKSSLTIWREYMKAAIKKYGEYDFSAPSGIINMLIDKETGLPAHSGEKNVFLESFVEGMAADNNASTTTDTRPSESSWEEDSYLSQ